MVEGYRRFDSGGDKNRPPQSDVDGLQEYFDKGKESFVLFKEQFRQRNYTAARDVLHDLGLEDNKQVLYLLGITQLRLGEEAQALSTFLKIVAFEEADGVTIQSYVILAYLYAKRGKYSMAKRCVDALDQVEVENVETHSIMAYVAFEERDFQRAIGYYRRALQLAPESHSLLNSLGYVHMLLGDLDKGRDYVSRALKIQPKNYAALHSMGMYFYLAGHFKPAHDFFSEAFRLHQDPLIKKHLKICEKKL